MALKYLFKMSFRKFGLIICFAIGIVLLAAVLAFLEPTESKDYIARMIILWVTIMVPLGLGWQSYVDISGNRAARAFPFIKSLYTTAIPLFMLIIALGSTASFSAVYSAAVLLTDGAVQRISDMLIITAAASAFGIVGGAVSSMLRYGSFAALLSIVVYSRLSLRGGFGLPLWAAVLVYAGAVAAAFALAAAINTVVYKKTGFKVFASPIKEGWL